MSEAIGDNVRILWSDPRVKGLERFFDTLLLLLRFLSLSYLLKRFFDGPRQTMRSSVIDAYCVLELAVLVILLVVNLGSVLESVVAAYILFEIYLNLFNIIFIGKFPAVNSPPASINRAQHSAALHECPSCSCRLPRLLSALAQTVLCRCLLQCGSRPRYYRLSDRRCRMALPVGIALGPARSCTSCINSQ